MFPKKEFEKRFKEILDELDDVMENTTMDEGVLDQLAELNAESEDALFLLADISEDEPDAAEAMEDALEEFIALWDDYRDLSETVSEIVPLVQRLGMVIELMKNNI